MEPKEHKKASRLENVFENKLAYGPITIPFDDIAKKKFLRSQKKSPEVRGVYWEGKILSDESAQDDGKSCGF